MSKGIIYIMTSVLPGLIKIGKTGSDQFEKRMDFLEKNGACFKTSHFGVTIALNSSILYVIDYVHHGS